MPSPLFSQFTPPTYPEWVAATTKSLKGKPFTDLNQCTPEGIAIKPLYQAEDIVNLPHLNGRIPTTPKTWLIAQALPYSTAEQLNNALQEDLARGQTAVLITPDLPSKLGYNPDAVLSTSIGKNGTSLATVADWATVLNKIDPDIPLFIDGGEANLPHLALLLAQRQTQNKTTNLHGGLFNDPIASQLIPQCRTTPAQLYDETAVITQWSKRNAPAFTTLAVNATIYQNGGGNSVQQLAFAMSTAIAHIRALQKRDFTIDDIAPRIRFLFAIGSDFFMEIAKLRAARLLWAQIVDSFGGSVASQKISIHAQTAVSNKSILDPHNNMLRSTTEALAAAIANVDSLQTDPFDARNTPPNEFSRRIARNQQLILQTEINLTQLADPVAGSYYAEYLTDQLAQHAWAYLQEVESQGGMLKSLQNGFPQAEITHAAQEAATRLATRKDILVGVNQYTTPDAEQTAPQTAQFDVQTRRQQFATLPPIKIGEIINMETAVSAAQAGATLGQLTTALRPQDHPSTINSIPVLILAQPFEQPLLEQLPK